MGREIRDKFKPGVDEEGVYLHVFNHCVENRENDFPLGDVEKYKFLQHVKRTLTLYSIECLSAVVTIYSMEHENQNFEALSNVSAPATLVRKR